MTTETETMTTLERPHPVLHQAVRPPLLRPALHHRPPVPSPQLAWERSLEVSEHSLLVLCFR